MSMALLCRQAPPFDGGLIIFFDAPAFVISGSQAVLRIGLLLRGGECP